jgi:hypothetical protein
LARKDSNSKTEQQSTVVAAISVIGRLQSSIPK